MKRKFLLLPLLTIFISTMSGCSSLTTTNSVQKNNVVNFNTAADISYDTIATFEAGKNSSQVKLINGVNSINGPCSFSIDDSGSIYLLNTLGKNIIIKSKGETRTINIDNVNTATDIYVDNYIYVYDSFKDNPSVFKLDKTGTVKQVYRLKGKISYPEIYKLKVDSEYGLSLSSGGMGIIPLNSTEKTPTSKTSVNRYEVDIQDNNKIIFSSSNGASNLTINIGKPIENAKLLKDDGNLYMSASIIDATPSLIEYKNLIGIIDANLNKTKFYYLPSDEYYNPIKNSVFISKDGQLYFMITSNNEVKICIAK